jgi:stalled ribosome rescue protein Dom34
MPVILWIDRNFARLFVYDKSPPTEHTIYNTLPTVNGFYADLANQLESVTQILIVGPGVSKYRIFAYLRETTPQIARKVVGCETLDQCHDFQLRAMAEKYLSVVLNDAKV